MSGFIVFLRHAGTAADGLPDGEDFDRVGTDEFAVQELIAEVTDLPGRKELLLENADAERLTLHDPVEREVSESGGLRAGRRGGHLVYDADGFAEDGIVGMIPQAVSVIVLQQLQRQRRFVVHQPGRVLAVLFVHREEETDHIVERDLVRGDAGLRSVFGEDARRHILAGPVDEAVVLGAAEGTSHPADEVIGKDVGIVVHETVVQFEDGRQLMVFHRKLGEVEHPVVCRDLASVRHPGRRGVGMLGDDLRRTVVRVHIGADGAEEALFLERLREFVGLVSRQDISAGKISARGQFAVAALLSADIVHETLGVFRLIGKIQIIVHSVFSPLHSLSGNYPFDFAFFTRVTPGRCPRAGA